MDCSELTVGKRFRVPLSRPIVAEIVIDPADWYDFQRLDADNPETQIISHTDTENGAMAVHVACISDEVKGRLEDAWA